MSTQDIPPLVPDPRPGHMHDPALPPLGPTVPDIQDVDIPGEPLAKSEEPRQPPDRTPVPEPQQPL